MQKRILGNSGLEVSALGLGCMGLSYCTLLNALFDAKAVLAYMRGSWNKEPELNVIKTGEVILSLPAKRINGCTLFRFLQFIIIW